MRLKLYKKVEPRKGWWLGLFTFAFVLVIWQLVAASGWVKPYFLPSPVQVVGALVDLSLNHDLAAHIGVSVWRVGAGFVLAAMVAIPLGLLIGTHGPSAAAFAPFNDFLRYMPVVAFVPLCILWAGIGDEQKILVIFLGIVFQLVPMVADATAAVPRVFVETAATLGLNNRNIFQRVVWPAAQPQIFDHLRVAVGWGWSYIVVAELVAAERGIGHVIIQAQRFLRTDQVMAGILAVGLLGLITDLIFRQVGRHIYGWHESKR
uniref:NitT/TauT family transport system permease protein n=1 Tax=Candidatus Kentrum sp. TC TaxID=2126339 RepID=A0A450YQK7_9GAMM|nr:MAG: NitT/TauT family transport system permease protein [Candidatus Kentron sp. TC]